MTSLNRVQNCMRPSAIFHVFGFSGRFKFHSRQVYCLLCIFFEVASYLALLYPSWNMKRRRDTQSGAGNVKKRVTHDTFRKWQRDFDRECQTMTWLDCETGTESGKKIVDKLKCRVCTKYVDKIRGRKNFSDKWLCGADSVRTSNVRDHTHNDQRTYVMSLLKKERAGPLDWVQHRMLPSRRPKEL